mmetsp:Transcript_37414/g.57316  ORF Transcript_37414/g.57316 Transcript_37414/m.57316 type:complete len:105 (+) Transcript_37414:962-1276(+)
MKHRLQTQHQLKQHRRKQPLQKLPQQKQPPLKNPLLKFQRLKLSLRPKLFQLKNLQQQLQSQQQKTLRLLRKQRLKSLLMPPRSQRNPLLLLKLQNLKKLYRVQ